MKVIVLSDPHDGRVAGAIVGNYVYFDEDVEKAVKEHLEKIYRAWDIRYDRTTLTVHFTFGGGGGAPVNSSFKVKTLSNDALTEYERDPIKMNDGKIIPDHY